VPSFPLLDSFINENEIQTNPELVANIKDHCENLITDFTEYFPENLTPEFWIRKPCSFEDILPELVTTNKKDELTELSCDGSLQQTFKMDLMSLVGKTKGIPDYFCSSCNISVGI
jgi:hypothetical protein